MGPLVQELQRRTGRYGEAEKYAWESSLGLMAQVLRRTRLGEAHIHLDPPSMSLEYRLPASSSWCDAVLLGRGRGTSAAVVLELKDWELTGDEPGPREGLVRHQGRFTLHPGEQLRGYVEYCRRFHSAVQEAKATVSGCVFFTRAADLEAYRSAPHARLAELFPLFGASEQDLVERLPRHLEGVITEPDPAFATAFEQGTYHQERNFVRQVAAALQDPANEQFVLLDHQRLGFERCLEVIERVRATRARAVIVVVGPPGSGKSVLAANLWARLVHDPRFQGSVVFTTTSASQKANWKTIFEGLGETPGAAGVVVPANEFNPGLTPAWVKQMRSAGKVVEVETWKDNLELFRRAGARSRMPEDQFDVAIVDEAHALIDPTAPGKRGVSPSGWAMHAGPQAWHILRAARVSVLLMDAEQSYRDNESTSLAALSGWAAEQGAALESISLEDAQFRCGGSKEYLDWLDGLFTIRPSKPSTFDWRRKHGQGAFTFEIVEDPGELEACLRGHLAERHTARLAASYSRLWKTKGVDAPHGLPPEEMDFCMPYVRGGEQKLWSRIWNYAPESRYELWVQAPEGSVMHSDPLAEVGCPYVIRGFDYDYLGILWMSDLRWREDAWEADPAHVHESAWRKTLAAARKAAPGDPAREQLTARLLRGYRILFSRAIRGVYVWFEDAETRARVEHALANSSLR
jgi:hypothetical protein